MFYLGIRQLYQNTAVPFFFSFIFHIKKFSHYQPVQLVTHYQKPALVFHVLENWIQVTGCHGNCISGHFLFQLFSHQKKKKKVQLYQMEINECLLLLLKSMQLNEKVIILFDQVFPPTLRNKGRSVHPKWEKKSALINAVNPSLFQFRPIVQWSVLRLSLGLRKVTTG